MNDDQSSTNTSTQGMKTVEEWRQKYLKGPCNYAVTELILDVQAEAIEHTRRESAAEIERFKERANDLTFRCADLESELAALRSQQQPATPSEPTESPLDKAAREAYERWNEGHNDETPWRRESEHDRDCWRRVVAPFVKDEPPKPRKTDGELLTEAGNETGNLATKWEEVLPHWQKSREKMAALFLAKRAERDGVKR